MKAQSVLNKIMTLLSIENNEEVKLAYAKLADGTILESPSFDLGEPVEVVSEDGTKSKAPEGEHEIALRDSEGNDVIIRIVVDAEGKITERENVEEAQPEAPEVGESEIESEIQMAEEPMAEGEVAPTEAPAEDEKAAKIKELEDKILALEALINEFQQKKEQQMEEVDVPKLDGAPVEEQTVQNFMKPSKRIGETTFDRVLRNLSK
jgi:hypothetical protein